MNGSLQVKKNKYYLVIKIKHNDGKWSSKWISTGLDAPKMKKEAEKLLRKTLVKLEEDGDDIDITSIATEDLSNETKKTESKEKNGVSAQQIDVPIMIPVLTPSGQIVYAPNIQAQRQTSFSDYISQWLSERKKDKSIDIVTFEGYESACKNHFIPYFKSRKLVLEQISYRDIQEYFDHEALCGNLKTKEGLSVKTLQDLKKTLTQIFKTARRDKLIFENPCEFVKLPKQVKCERTVLSKEQAADFFEKIKDEDIFPILYLTMIYGLRRSEILGLKWDSIDFDKMTVTIKHTIVKGKKIYKKDSTKTNSSWRTYPMSEDIKEILLHIKEAEENNRIKYSENYNDNDYVFKWNDGSTYNPNYISRKFKKLLSENNMPDLRFHDLRHSCASVLASNGYQIKDVQEWLGHADIGTTANTYSHLFKDRKEQILDAMKF